VTAAAEREGERDVAMPDPFVCCFGLLVSGGDPVAGDGPNPGAPQPQHPTQRCTAHAQQSWKMNAGVMSAEEVVSMLRVTGAGARTSLPEVMHGRSALRWIRWRCRPRKRKASPVHRGSPRDP
jgi:hypothetical protein